ncbi:glycogen debranching protein [Alginatibacterium sediminis]|uniref:Glycogen debranching protein n=1 Tax=Alginatibacterium sediminis TaxID=2164068 RepID=A0A420E5K4_9ALTE|nr:amylo-alpha-1,6-glucosidase [Alginatibacterium sediminis]RKF12817.1 glycogen debranching protein [Alginatibacterium sediminis]
MTLAYLAKSILRDFEAGSTREFLVSNGRGSYSSAAVNGNLARKFHGLYVKAMEEPMGRYIGVHKVEEEIDGVDLAVYRYKTGDLNVLGDGQRYLDRFEIDVLPTWYYGVGNLVLKKQLCFVYGSDLLLVRYQLNGPDHQSVGIRLNLFNHFRQASNVDDSITKLSPFKTEYERLSKGLLLRQSDSNYQLTLSLQSNHGQWQNTLSTVPIREHIAYEIEMGEQGDYRLDSSQQFAKLNATLISGQSLWIAIGNEQQEQLNDLQVESYFEQETQRIKALRVTCSSNKTQQDLAQAIDKLIVDRPSVHGKTILAGYPWFGDWGRDTMIALPGACLSTGRHDDARKILQTFAHYCSEGMLPNKFPDYASEPLRYNTIDASLWYFWAIQMYLESTADLALLEELFPCLESIINAHIAGTRFDIKVQEDGLLSGGDSSTQLTWMDVKYQGKAVTPRYGKAVEINALWYNALRAMQMWANQLGHKSKIYQNYADQAQASYIQTFWNEERGCLYDYVCEQGINADLRPNQIFAVSLPFSVLSDGQAKAVVDKVWQHLWTPMGLRSLEPGHVDYHPNYFGPLSQRDEAYHQGTVWAWLIGHFIDAWQRVYQQPKQVEIMLQSLIDHFYQDAGIMGISEVFDGQSPNQARGCFNQAWSVAEVLRVLKRYEYKE